MSATSVKPNLSATDYTGPCGFSKHLWRVNGKLVLIENVDPRILKSSVREYQRIVVVKGKTRVIRVRPYRRQIRKYAISPKVKALVLLAALGLTHSEIAKALGKKKTSCKNQLCVFYKKYGLSNRGELRAFISANPRLFVRGGRTVGDGVINWDFAPLSNQQLTGDTYGRNEDKKIKDLA